MSVWAFFEQVAKQMIGKKEKDSINLNQYINTDTQQLIKLPSLKNDENN